MNLIHLSNAKSARQRLLPWLVWGIWGSLLLLNISVILTMGRNIPLAEDWTMVPLLTGQEPHFWQWLWSQNNEHRVPLPRLIFLALLNISGGDFRSGMVFNVFVLAALSAGSLCLAYRLRQRQTRLVDMALPIALMHWGQWPNLFWSWQLSFVTPFALIYSTLLILLWVPTLATVWAATMVGLAAMLLPLCGAIGLLFMPFYTFWLGYCGWLHWRSQRRSLSGLLWGSALAAIAVSLVYFVGYEKPTWNPPSPGIFYSLKTTAMVVSLGLGPVVKRAWPLFSLLSFGFLLAPFATVLSSAVKSVKSTRGYVGPDFDPSSELGARVDFRSALRSHLRLGMLLFALNSGLLLLSIGYGRAALVPSFGLPLHYGLLATLPYLWAFWAWELYGKQNWHLRLQQIFAVGLVLLLPFNMLFGMQQWGRWYQQGMGAVEQDIVAGVTFSEMAEKHGEFLVHWWDHEQLARHMENLKKAQMTEFKMAENSPDAPK